MNFFLLALIAAVCTSIAAEDDLLDQAVTKCLDKLNLAEAEQISEQDTYCLFGCLLQEFNMIDGNGKLLPNGIEDFTKSLPAEYAATIPNLLDDLTKLKPEILNAVDSCDAGRIVSPILGELFETEFEAEDEAEDETEDEIEDESENKTEDEPKLE